ncbi:bola-like protein [Volvox carteri f. nagariensis]|uniref:Bola-like protein n=1 Tax=Volvox carteri f. nagariensis TaxID=3068 RepID=D8U984_VOLCA|nr:bola-like protein [Volvox carteri f. nagariensis]EFJ43764.1 bola-like protein [Volvox carteri f. nagariensis]|eukprot:XP_002955245.1 bola-like protein [Volvox carteri f. nagariensis]
MATLLTSRSCVVARHGRLQAQEHYCKMFQPALAMPIRRSALPSLEAASREQRSLASVSTWSIPVSGPGSPSVASSSGGVAGQVTAELMNSMRGKICEALETDTCTVTDVYGDGRHVSIEVVSKLFADKNSMQRQRMVYKAIWLELQEAVHAVDSMTTRTPEEAGK